jgi:hypothetical protein
MNFDTRIASPLTGNTVPFFSGNGARSGSCTLICHGVAHDPVCTDLTGALCVNSQY